MNAVVIGGGHGIGATIQAMRALGASMSVVVGVADDGGSTGLLRAREPALPGIGDARHALSSLIGPDEPFARLLEHRVRHASLQPHPIGNAALVALWEQTGSLVEALRVLGDLAGVTERLLPAAEAPLVLRATTADGGTITGQLAIHLARGVREVSVDPADAVCPLTVDAIVRADVVVLGPGSLFTSVLAAAVSPGIREALSIARARVVFVANLARQEAETMELDADGHLERVLAHGVRVDAVVADHGFTPRAARHRDVLVRSWRLRGQEGAHDPTRLAEALGEVLDALGVHRSGDRKG
ncbi:protein of unknown function UPF0052 and CofD [Acidimicrobium ferrooxidans DSM 10331]|uniref:Gluconeogenesis factor n=1 Tax=Acidimicrobium ferrooxidans (strain DSM 10331 / JCM 15462 / NBRC 103882 / ICP) TaxID=525909 RepID=C7LYI6_ACIFD|nr:gluconeogenesis factor YvcK family protein [Acidimicrobium ferrooxidans]ACU53794.1 protein of unknown function UPF0052 and CofD [Acidimicrobium ferrooxidans DSM 10331]